MANLHIELPETGRLAAKIRALVEKTRDVSEDVSEVLGICQAFGAPTEYTALRTAIGLGNDAAAEAMYALLVAAQARLTGAAITNFVDRLG